MTYYDICLYRKQNLWHLKGLDPVRIKFVTGNKITEQVNLFNYLGNEEFKYLGTTLTNQISILEEIKSRLRSGNACYHSVRIFCLPGC